MSISAKKYTGSVPEKFQNQNQEPKDSCFFSSANHDDINSIILERKQSPAKENTMEKDKLDK